MPVKTRTADANVYVTTYDTAILNVVFPEWPALTREEKYRLLRAYRGNPRALGREERVGNITTDSLHAYLAASIDPEQSVDEGASMLVVGRGDTSPSTTNTDVNDRIGTTGVTDTIYSASTGELQVTTFVDSTQFNEETIREVGVLSDADSLWNHAVLGTSIEKSNVKTFTIDVFFTITES